MEHYERWQKSVVEQRLAVRRIVVISGPRQSGKTTLAKSIFPAGASYFSLDTESILKVAQADPDGFIRQVEGPVIIDEIQRAPQLILAIKTAVDNNPRPGQFLLTGSSDILALPTVLDSLAGRASYIRLRPLAQGEILRHQPTFVQRIFSADFQGLKTGMDRKAIAQRAIKGGYPEALILDEPNRKIWYEDYIDTLIKRDLKDIANVRIPSAIYHLIATLAAWSSKFIDISSVGRALEVGRVTVDHYIKMLELMFLVESVPYWWQTDYERVGKQAKFFMTDTGLMAALLNWRLDDVLFDSDKIGKLMETFVFTELKAQLEAHPERCMLHHYRDRQKREIDFIIEGPDGALVGIEVKAGSAVGKDDFKHLRWFKDNLAKQRPFTGIVLYTGEHALPQGPGFWAVPLSALFE